MAQARTDVPAPVTATPFLKWAGGKAQVLPQLAPLFPARFERYHEPFVGGGAVFFALASQRRGLAATLIDANPDLMNCYRVVRDRLADLMPLLREHQANHAKDYYYALRAQHDLPPVEAAARFIYLNKTCYNGLYRVNSKGQFNVPMGNYVHPRILDEEVLRAASDALQGVDLVTGDFSQVLEEAQEGDFIYFDPPFVPVSPTANFTGYWVSRAGKAGFGEEEQARLAQVYRELDRRGCKLVLSNSDCDLIHDLYAGFDIRMVQVPRLINSNPEKRGPVAEVVVRNFSAADHRWR
ncbi:MAG: DNA adenine methylase [Chloroflexi bacterium]|nr:DNA adenine methylase [Chloroflexota bacterium]